MWQHIRWKSRWYSLLCLFFLLQAVAPGARSLCCAVSRQIHGGMAADDCSEVVVKGRGCSAQQVTPQTIDWSVSRGYCQKMHSRAGISRPLGAEERVARRKWSRSGLQSSSSSAGPDARGRNSMRAISMRLRGGAVTLRKRKAVEPIPTDATPASSTSKDRGQDAKQKRAAAARQGPGSKRGAPRKTFVDDGGDAEGDSSQAEKRRKEMEWANINAFPAAPPQVIDREYTLEEDLALISKVENELRRACDVGDKQRAKKLLQQGAIVDEWDDCTDLCVETLCDAQWEVWEERRTGFPADIPTLRAANEAEREMLTAAGLDPSESDSPVEYFLSCQMTGEIQDTIWNEDNSKFRKRLTRDALAHNREMTKEEFPFLQERKSAVDFATFQPGDDEKSGSSEDSEEYDATEFHGFINPVGRKVMKVELALLRNATEELDSEELEVAAWMDPPCEALQDLMSESVSEQDGILMTIPKMSTEITQAELDPWDQANDMRLSDTFGQKSFDFVDSLAGFERANSMLGLRGSDQNYGVVRSRFLKSQAGSYKRPSTTPFTTRKGGMKGT